MDWGWLRVLVEKLRIHSIVGCGVFVALCAIFISQDLWILILTGLQSFLLIELIIYLFEVFIKKQKTEKVNLQNKYKHEAEQKQYSDLIWHLFLGLSEMNMKLLLVTFDAPRDPSDKYVRIINPRSLLYSQLESSRFSGYCSSDPFTVSIDSMYSIACLERKYIGDSMIVHFDPYLYGLVEEFLKTGIKSKI